MKEVCGEAIRTKIFSFGHVENRMFYFLERSGMHESLILLRGDQLWNVLSYFLYGGSTILLRLRKEVVEIGGEFPFYLLMLSEAVAFGIF